MKKAAEKNTQKNQVFSTLALTIAAVIGNNLPAQALYINFTYDPGVTSEYKAAAEMVGRYWQDYLTDNTTVNIHLDVADAYKLPTGVLGGSMPAFVSNLSYDNFRQALTNDRISGDDYTAVSYLPGNSSEWCAFIEGYLVCNSQINLTRANAKALNLIDPFSTQLDATIVMSDLKNTSYRWETNRNNYVDSWEFDFTSVLIHEIGHALGFVSAVDSINSSNIGIPQDRFKYITPLNLFTRDTGGSTLYNQASVTYGHEAYFSINGGQTNLGNFSTGKDPSLSNPDRFFGYGDGWQNSHWKPYINAMMNPALPLGTRRNLTSLDLTAFDVMGWDIDVKNYADSTLVSWGQQDANYKGNTDNIVAINNLFNQYRWGGGSSSTNFAQGMDLTQFLAQEGLFQKGSFWSYLDEVEANADMANAVPESNSVLGLLGLSFLGFMSGKKSKN